MTEKRATSRAGINIALIKYWGKRDETLNLPAVSSISLTLAELGTVTTVIFDDSVTVDPFILNGQKVADPRVFQTIETIRGLANIDIRAHIESTNSAPTASGLASSASGSAALVHAAWRAAGLPEAHRSMLEKGSLPKCAPKAHSGTARPASRSRGGIPFPASGSAPPHTHFVFTTQATAAPRCMRR